MGSTADFETYTERPPARSIIDVAEEDLDESLLAHLYRSLLRLVDILEQRYETTLEEDETALAATLRISGKEIAPETWQEQQGQQDQHEKQEQREQQEQQWHLQRQSQQQLWRSGEQQPRLQAGMAEKRRRLGTFEASATNSNETLRPNNVRNVLLLRIGQKKLLRELRTHAEDCFLSDDCA